MMTANTKMIYYPLNRKIVNAFKKGNIAIISFTHSNGSSTYRFSLGGFTDAFNKIENSRYYSR